MTSTSDRWIAACHEAGPGVVGFELGGTVIGLAVASVDGFGLADVRNLSNDNVQVMTAAGPASEYLAAEHEAPPLPDLDMITPAPVDPMDSDASRFDFAVARSVIQPGHFQSDARSLALWAITGHEDDPAGWQRRVAFVKHVAADLVGRNADRIVRLAGELFVRGRLSRTEIENLLKGARL